MRINDQIRDEKLQQDINRKAGEISALSSGKTHKYEYLTGKDILPSNRQQVIKKAKFNYSPWGKAFEKQIKTIEDQGENQIKAQTKSVEGIFPEGYKIAEIKNKTNKIKKYEKSQQKHYDLLFEQRSIQF